MSTAIAILVPSLEADVGIPEQRPLGRAALLAAELGIHVIFATETRGGLASGVHAQPGRWETCRDVPIAAIYDRFPCQSQPERHRTLLRGLPGVPVANPPSLVALCRDKLAAQRVLQRRGIPMPEVVDDPHDFEAVLEHWGSAFLKPREGSFGEGVQRITDVCALPPLCARTDYILQRAIPPREGWAGLCCRVLVQRAPDGSFCAPTPVVRRSRTDPVVNAARGAEVLQLTDALPDSAASVISLGIASAVALAEEPDGDWLAEVGVDIVIDEYDRPFVIEVNGRPRGRLEVLAARDPGRWQALHEETCLRPIHWLWVAALRE